MPCLGGGGMGGREEKAGREGRREGLRVRSKGEGVNSVAPKCYTQKSRKVVGGNFS